MLLRERLESLGRRPPSGARRVECRLEELAAGLGGEVRENRGGPYVLLEAVHPMPRAAAWDTGSPLLSGVAAEQPLIESRLCFFDTETTGLSSGVGNQVFLLATAWRLPQGLLVRQFLLPDPAYEGGFLEAVVEDLGAGSALVSYNGRSFDAPVLEGRLVLSRRTAECLRGPHLDLLYPTRRVFRARLGRCNLRNVEALVLGRDRGDDIPGYLIPEAYFGYLRRGDPEILRDVLAHNRQDVVSLSLLLDHLLGVLQGCLPSPPLDRFGAGRFLEAAGLSDRAAAVYQTLWQESDGGWDGDVWPGAWTPVDLAYVVGLRLATLNRRLGRPQRSQRILEQLWRRHPRPWEAGVMLAKDLEHRRRNPFAALEIASAAKAALENLPYRSRPEERWLNDLWRRERRLRLRTAGD